MYTRINWTNTLSTPLNADNLNNMDKAIYDLQALHILATFPNQVNNKVLNSQNFANTSNWSVENGTLTAENGLLVIDNSTGAFGAASTTAIVNITEPVVINSSKRVLVKMRVKKLQGSNATIIPQLLTPAGACNISGDNAIGNITGGDLQLLITDNEWHDIWCIVSSTADTEIQGVGLIAEPFSNVALAYIQLFYDGDIISVGNNASELSTTQFTLNYTADNCTVEDCIYESEEIQ